VKFELTFNRAEAKKERSPRWTVAWSVDGEEQRVVAPAVRCDLVELESLRTRGSLCGQGHAYWEGEVLVLTRDWLPRAGQVF
jgi:hypothetical protein